jgi:alkylated DNA repair dioxygenase AlkB
VVARVGQVTYQKQISLISREGDETDSEPEICYVPEFVENHRIWFERLQSRLNWNRQYKLRKTATFGVSYNYRKGTKRAGKMPGFLEPVCEKIRIVFGYMPNNCLANYYPDGDHYISFHSDQDMEMKAQSGVTIISLGAIRNMVLRNINVQQQKYYYPLQPGSAFFMADSLQKEWQHGVLKEAGAGARISLSFRSLNAV